MKKLILLIYFCFQCLFLQAQSNHAQCNEFIKQGTNALHNSEYSNAFEYLNQAQFILNTEPNYKQQFLVFNNVGLIYLKMHDYKEAIKYLHKSYDLAMEHKELIDEMTVLNNIAIIYSKLEKYTEAEEYFQRSYELANQQKIKTHIGLYAINLANLYYDLKRYDEAEKFLLIADVNNIKNSRNYFNANLIKNAIWLEKKQPNEVISNINNLLNAIKRNNYQAEETEALLLLARAYQQKNNWETSNKSLNEALNLSTDNEVKKRIYEEKALNFFYLGNISELVSSKDSVISLNKKINDLNSKELLENASLKFELSKSNYDLELQKIDKKNQNRIYLLSIILLLCLFGFILYVYYKRNTSIKQKKIIAENDLKIKKLQLEQEITNRILLEEDFKQKSKNANQDLKIQKETAEQLKIEIDLKNKQLSDKILFQSTRNELLDHLISELNESFENTKNKKIVELTQQLKIHLKDDVKWEDFNQKFENINNHFLTQLNILHPELNANDIRFLSFIYLRLTTKEIANLLHITPESCRKRKERLRTKLKIDRETELYQYLIAL